MNEKKTIDDLRAVLFDTIEGVKSGKLEIERAKVISDLSQVMVNTAKAEVEFAKATGARGSAFLDMAVINTPNGALPLPADGQQERSGYSNGNGSVRRYVDGKLVSR